MRYFKRKMYVLLIFALWLGMMYCGLMIAGHYIPGLPKSSVPVSTLVSVMYWIVPILIIVVVFWYFSPGPTPGTNKKLTRRQKKMVADAIKDKKNAETSP